LRLTECRQLRQFASHQRQRIAFVAAEQTVAWEERRIPLLFLHQLLLLYLLLLLHVVLMMMKLGTLL
jgi:hypothetical protein